MQRGAAATDHLSRTPIRVRIPSLLWSYTRDTAVVEVPRAAGRVDDVLRDLDARFPGIRFRVVDEQNNLRKHVNVWLDGERCRDLAAPIGGIEEVVIMQALSGG